VKRKGNQHHGFCPLPNHNGKKNSPSFSANLEKGIFQCFGCGAKGNLLEFAALMEGSNPQNGEAFRDVALKLQKRFCTAPQKPVAEKKPIEQEPVQTRTEKNLSVVVNAPLDFELKRLDPDHPYLNRRGFTKETIERFSLGFCAKGLLAGRIAIPLHDRENRLLGYAGRIVDDALIDASNPRYKFPSARERNGVEYQFSKSLIIYNANRIQAPVQELAVVEGFTSVWWLTQMGFPNVIAPMGWAMSEEQGKIITDLISPEGRVWIVSDGDDAGDRGAVNVFKEVAPRRFVKWLKLERNTQPTDYPAAFYRERLR
jgi:DNA primase